MTRWLLIILVLSLVACDSKQQPAQKETLQKQASQQISVIKPQPQKNLIQPAEFETKISEQSNYFSDDYPEFDTNDDYDQEQIYYLDQLKNAMDPDIRIKAIDKLDDIEEPRILKHLQIALNDPDESVRLAIVEHLSGIDLHSATTSIIKSLQDSSPEVVLAAISAIEETADESLMAKLTPLLQHPDTRIQKRAEEVIAYIE